MKNQYHPYPLEQRILAPFACGAALLGALALLAAVPSASAQLTSTTTTAGGNTIVKFTGGSDTWTVPDGVTSVNVLVVGGGGGGGGNSGGGGGAGGVIHQTGFAVSGPVTVVVGGGGVGGVSGGAAPGSGANSVFSGLTATGGGNGASYGSPNTPAGSGGSGGGGSWTGATGGSGTTGQGNNGGTMNSSDGGYGGTGGGGAGAVGGPHNVGLGGAGGAGVQYSISGSAQYYGGGGGGGADVNRSNGAGGPGGAGGGGKGSDKSGGTAATAGTANTGGGGGGGANNGAGGNGAAGGSGVVIVSYPLPPTKLAFSSVPASPTAGQAFSVTVQAQDGGNFPHQVTSDTTVELSVISGSGTLSGTKIGTIGSGASSFVFSDLGYSAADAMTLQATVSSGMSLSSGTTNLTFESSPTVATPTFSLPAGAYLGVQTVTISCGTAGSTVFYTTDGSPPTIDSSRGEVGSASATVDIPVPADLTVKAIATCSGYLDSAVASAAYVTLTHPTWTNLAGGSWPDTGNWLVGVVGQGSGVTADFSTLTLSGNTIVTLDSSPTIGGLVFRDAGDASTWIVEPGSPTGKLTLDHGAGTPTITVSNRTATLVAPLAGAAGFVKAGAGKLVLGDASSFSGGSVTVQEGILQLDGPGSGEGQLMGVTTITVDAGGTLLTTAGDAIGWTSGMEALVIHGGTVTNDSGSALTLGNPVSMTGGTLSATGNGWITFFGSTQAINATSDASGNPATISQLACQNSDAVFVVTRGSLAPASDLIVDGISSRFNGVNNISVSGNGVMTLSGHNNHMGDTIVEGSTLKLASTGRLTFKPTTNGSSNKLTGTGTGTLDGGLVIDLTEADTTTGNSWTLVDVGTLAVTFDANFQVVDFSEQTPGSGVWTKTSTTTGGDLTWTFTHTTGQLTVARGGTNNYAGWASTHGIPGEPATGDFDLDGINNLMEYALGLEPTVPNGSTGTFTGKWVSFSKGEDAVANGDVTWAIEESDDLGLTDSWTEVATYTENSSTTLSCTLPDGKDKTFARLVVHQVP
ncbi:MAG: chitobiase/beta-hexosaminidase C-terminal domain-containing protein [Verrucomicrobia bacterium]|nr:chitobiase/beta-hexosaminidase C-terminal domain-containing protein [Verrucomicrobiota bacterium]